MKVRRINTLARWIGRTIALALIAGVAIGVKAGEIPTGKGGATKLLQLSGSSVTPKSEPSDYQAMSCAKCKDSTVAVTDTDSKGAGARTLVQGGAPTKLVTRHLCEGCANEWVVKGHGKAKQAIASHKCTSCGEASLACCNTKKGSNVATKGMEKKFEVAPLK